jgi:hypothetical protein
MLAVARDTRDAVLGTFEQISLSIDCSDSNIAPLARLLSRACLRAAPGLHVDLLFESGEAVEQHPVMSALLQPGVERGGWTNVHTLEVCTCS